jgi:hypothetical protein
MHRLRLLSTTFLTALLISFNFVMPDAVDSDAGLPGLNVVRITPAGMDVPTGRQIVFEFNRAVVPVGRMERNAAEIPITISPGLDCQWRWLNTRVLACRLDESDALIPATRYDLVVDPGIKTEDGVTLAAPVVHWFITERPKVRHAWFRTWKAPGMPFIRLTFNQPVSEESVEKHVFMMTDAPNKQQIGLKVEPDPDDKQTPFKDEFGRTLMASIDMQFATDHRPPDFTLTHSRAVLEKDVDSEVPLAVTNLKKVTLAYDRLTTQAKQSGRNLALQIPQAEDIAFRTPLQVREMLGGQSGVVQGLVDTNPAVSKHLWNRWFFAQVTPFQVHMKIGHYNTLVWVTEFKTGQPVAGATVKIFSDTYTALPQHPTILTRAVTDATGVAMLAGTREVDPKKFQISKIHILTAGGGPWQNRKI